MRLDLKMLQEAMDEELYRRHKYKLIEKVFASYIYWPIPRMPSSRVMTHDASELRSALPNYFANKVALGCSKPIEVSISGQVSSTLVLLVDVVFLRGVDMYVQ